MDVSNQLAHVEKWHYVGPVSSLPDIHQDEDTRAQVRAGCKTLCIPRPNQSGGSRNTRSNLDEQVLVFRYRGLIHAIDNKCPHSSFPLREGSILDIEDAGPNIRCFRHGWTFDLTTGQADRGNHKITLWHIELRDPLISGSDENGVSVEKEVWVRRRPNGIR
ncbi:hypothetical protein BJX99DRAFT_253408 [Aspergillus californicus]